MISRSWLTSCFCRRCRRRSSAASISSWTRAAAVVKRTLKPFWQAANPSPKATWDLPVPLGPKGNDILALIDELATRQLHGQNLVQRRNDLEVEAIQAFGRRELCGLDAAFYHPAFALDQLQFT